jgi:hypothetical protein
MFDEMMMFVDVVPVEILDDLSSFARKPVQNLGAQDSLTHLKVMKVASSFTNGVSNSFQSRRRFQKDWKRKRAMSVMYRKLRQKRFISVSRPLES